MKKLKVSILLVCALALLATGLPFDDAAAQTYKRLTVRVGGNLELPSGDFSETSIGMGGYANTGGGFEVGVLFRLVPELFVVGEYQRHYFTVYEDHLQFDSGISVNDAFWDVEYMGFALRGSFGEYDEMQMWLQGGTGWYQGFFSQSGDSLSFDATSDWNMGVNAGAGLLVPLHRLLVLEGGMRVHTLTLRFDEMFDKPTLWLSVGLALHVGIW